MRSADFLVGLRARRVCVALRPGPGTTTTQQVALAVPRSSSPRGQRQNCSRQEDSVQGCAHPSCAVDPKDFFFANGRFCVPAASCVALRPGPGTTATTTPSSLTVMLDASNGVMASSTRRGTPLRPGPGPLTALEELQAAIAARIAVLEAAHPSSPPVPRSLPPARTFVCQ